VEIFTGDISKETSNYHHSIRTTKIPTYVDVALLQLDHHHLFETQHQHKIVKKMM